MLDRLRRLSSRSRLSATTGEAAPSSSEFASAFAALAQAVVVDGVDGDTLFEHCDNRAETLLHMHQTTQDLLRALRRARPKAFISHFKVQAGTSAQLLSSMMERNGVDCFLDSDDLVRLDSLAFQVLSSKFFYLLMSAYDEAAAAVDANAQFGPFGRPYCIVEIITWFLNREEIPGKVIWLMQHGKQTSRFPSSLEEMTQILDANAWDVVASALGGRKDANVLAFQASQALRKLEPVLEWNPSHLDRNVSRAQFKAIIESSGIEAVHLDPGVVLAANKFKRALKNKQEQTGNNTASNAATTTTSSAPKSRATPIATNVHGQKLLQVSIICNEESLDEAALITTRTETEFADQVEVSTLSRGTAAAAAAAADGLGTFVLVLMTPKLLEDGPALQAIARAMHAKATLIPIVISRIGLAQFDYSQSPSALVVGNNEGERVLQAFALLKTILGKPLAPHSSSNQVSVQLGAIWGQMGLSSSMSQFRGVPYLRDHYSIVLAKAAQFVPGTREWIFARILEWSSNKKPGDNIFPLVSSAGLGKSVIQAEFCRRYSASVRARAGPASDAQTSLQVNVVAFHFFKHDDTSLNDAKIAVGSIARQLANTVDGFRTFLEESLKTCSVEDFKNLETLFRKCVLDPARRVEETSKPSASAQPALLVVLDGLDECLDRRELGPILANLWPQISLLRLVVSTRPDVDQWDRFSPLLLKPDDANNLQDLRVFLQAKLGAEHVAVMDIVERNANGLFLYAVFACEQLQHFSAGDMELAARNLPVSMDGIYVEYFSVLQQEFQDDPMLYTGALAPVLASRVPIPEKVWMEACFEASSSSFTKRVPGSQLAQLKALTEFRKRVKEPLLRLLDFSAGSVSFLHKSMGDFLQTTNQVELRVNAQIGHELMSLVCKRFKFASESWEKLRGAEEVYVASQSLYHYAKAGGEGQADALDTVLDMDKLIRNLRVAQLDSNYGRFLDDLRSLLDQHDEYVKFTQSLMLLVEKAVMHDPRELAGQILGRVMIPPFDAQQQHWIDQARDWLKRSKLQVPVPAWFGTSGLQPAGTALLRIVDTNNATYVRAICIAPNGTFAAVASGSTTRLYDTLTWKPLLTLNGPVSSITRCVSISADSKLVFTGGEGDKVRLYEVSTGRLVKGLKPHPHVEVLSSAFSLDGKYLLTGAKTNTAYLWDVAMATTSSKEISLVTSFGYGACVNAVAFSPDCTSFACGLADGQTKVYSLTGKPSLLTTLARHSKEIRSVAYSPDSSMICTASLDKTAIIWNATTFKKIRVLQPHSWGVLAVQFAPNGQFVVTGGEDKQIRIFDVKSGELRTTLRGHHNHVTSIGISLDSETILTGSTDHSVRLWDAKASRATRKYFSHRGGVRALSVSPDFKWLCTASNDRTFKIWDVETNMVLRTTPNGLEGLTAVKIAPDSLTIAVGSYDHLVNIWRNEKLVQSLRGLNGPARKILFTPDSKFVWAKTFAETGDVVWEIETGEIVERPFSDFVDTETYLASSREGFVPEFSITGENGEEGVALTLDFEHTKLFRFENKLVGPVGDSFAHWTLGDSVCREEGQVTLPNAHTGEELEMVEE